jgi:hypothetical protein
MRRAVTPLHCIRLRSRRSVHVVLGLLLGGTAARAQDFVFPPSLLLPNYDRVHPGLSEAIEAGAFIARARNAPAVAYNPAGISLTDRSVLNASAQGYQLTALGGTGFAQASPVSSFEGIPSFLGIVFGRDILDWEAVRLGFAVVTPVHWDQSAIANSTPQPSQRVSYTVASSFSTVVPTFAVGWVISSSIRLGASIEFPYTSLSDQGELSSELTTATTSLGSIRNVAVGGSTLDVVGVVGAQWNALSWLELGLVFRSPGLHLVSSGAFHYEALNTLGTGSRHIFLSDPNARFEYRAPMEVALGTAVTFGPVQLEVDLRWHDGTHTYQLFSSTQQFRVVDTTSGTPVVSSQPFTGINARASPVLNGSVGAHLSLSPTLSLSAGVYVDQSPVGLLGQGFRHVDMLGFRTGVGFQVARVSASFGVGWEHGRAKSDLVPDAFAPANSGELVTLNTFTVLFSVSYSF